MVEGYSLILPRCRAVAAGSSHPSPRQRRRAAERPVARRERDSVQIPPHHSFSPLTYSATRRWNLRTGRDRQRAAKAVRGRPRPHSPEPLVGVSSPSKPMLGVMRCVVARCGKRYFRTRPSRRFNFGDDGGASLDTVHWQLLPRLVDWNHVLALLHACQSSHIVRTEWRCLAHTSTSRSSSLAHMKVRVTFSVSQIELVAKALGATASVCRSRAVRAEVEGG